MQPIPVLLFFLVLVPQTLSLTSWEDFKVQFNKTYSSPHEELRRRAIFEQNVIIAESLNHNSTGTVYGVTQFMDLTRSEFRTMYLGSNIEGLSQLPVLNFTSQSMSPPLGYSTVFNWVAKGVTTPIYNQGECGACWAFSVTEQHESMRALAGYGLTALSMQQLVDCSTNGNMGCAGGYPLYAWAYLATVGHELYQDYPYTGEDQQCAYDSTGVPSGAFVKSYGLITSTNDETAMLDYLTSTGPISVCVDASNWQYYTSGVIMASQCGNQVDHCVQIVGIDENIEKSGVSAWIVRNSWGTGWGYDGYCYVQAGANACQIATVPTTCIV